MVVGSPNGVAKEEAWTTCFFILSSRHSPTANLSLPLLFRELLQHNGAAERTAAVMIN
jgi:hypothetical protein